MIKFGLLNCSFWLVFLQGPQMIEAAGCGVSQFKLTPRDLRKSGKVKADKLSWPWQASLQGIEAECGGALITPNVVLTAAHCVTYIDKNYVNKYAKIPASGLVVVLGQHSKTNFSDENVQVRKVKKIEIHENFNPDEEIADIAVLTLNTPADLNERVGLICLGSEPIPDGTSCYATGFGVIDQKATGTVVALSFRQLFIRPSSEASVLRQVYAPYIDWKKCESLLPRLLPGKWLNESMCCAGDLNGGQDVCAGDSGGPLSCWSHDRWTLHGLVSWGAKDNCGIKSRTIGVYVNIPYMYDWILENTDYGAISDQPKHQTITPLQSVTSHSPLLQTTTTNFLLSSATPKPQTVINSAAEPQCPNLPETVKPLPDGYCQPGMNGRQKIRIMNGSFIDVICDSKTDGGGWLIVHKRSASLSPLWVLFNPPVVPIDQFRDYGDDFWIGMNTLRQLTSAPTELLLKAHWCDGKVSHHKYQNFRLIGNQIVIDPSSNDTKGEGLGSLRCRDYYVFNADYASDKSTVELLYPIGCDMPQPTNAFWYTSKPQRRKTFQSFELQIRPMKNPAHSERSRPSRDPPQQKLERIKRQSQLYRHCHHLYKQENIRLSGKQTLKLDDAEIQIFCDMDSYGGGWTVIQQRTSGDESFQRSWEDYAKGFGDVTKDFWLGNRIIHKLTRNEQMDLKIHMEFCDGSTRTQTHRGFAVESEAERFSLRCSVGSPQTSYYFNFNHKRDFITATDDSEENCVKQMGGGGWWYNNCATKINLNGKFGCDVRYPQGNFFQNPLTEARQTIRTTKMMIRPSNSDLKGEWPPNKKPTFEDPPLPAGKPKKSCQEYYDEGDRLSGMKVLRNADSNVIATVFCDMSDPQHTGGWIVIMRRADGSVKFDRDWLEYFNGFGSMPFASRDYWVGNYVIYLLAIFNGPMDLLVDVTFCSGEKISRLYRNFTVENNMNRFRVTLIPQDQFKDGLSSINGTKFYAANLPNSVPNCGNTHGGGAWWWSNGPNCTKANLSGKFGCDVPYPTNMYWIKNDHKIEVISSVVMKVHSRI